MKPVSQIMETLITPIEVNTTINYTKADEKIEYAQSSLSSFYSNKYRKVSAEQVNVSYYSTDILRIETFLNSQRDKSFIWNYTGKVYWCNSYSVEYQGIDSNNRLKGRVSINLARDTNYV